MVARPPDPDDAFNRRFRRWLMRHNAQKVASLTYVHRSTVYEWLKGRTPTPERRRLIESVMTEDHSASKS